MVSISNRDNTSLRFIRLLHRRRRFRTFRQTGNSNCLDATIQMLCSWHGIPIPIASELRRVAGSDSSGTSIAGAKHCLEQIGFDVQVGQCDFAGLPQIRSPFLAVINNDLGALHYVLVHRVGGRSIRYCDPATGARRRCSQAVFTAMWTGYVILATPGKPREAPLFRDQITPQPISRWH